MVLANGTKGDIMPAMALNPEISRVTDTFDRYVESQHQRFSRLQATLKEGLPLVSDLPVCNNRLVEVGRPDLVITTRAQMQPIETPRAAVLETNNFGAYFNFYLENEDRSRSATLTAEQVSMIRNGISTKEVFGEEWPAAQIDTFSHLRNKSFHRMLALFPDFTSKFLVDAGKEELHPRDFEPEIFVAYQFMSRLVDVDDKHVLRDGKVDERRLMR